MFQGRSVFLSFLFLIPFFLIGGAPALGQRFARGTPAGGVPAIFEDSDRSSGTCAGEVGHVYADRTEVPKLEFPKVLNHRELNAAISQLRSADLEDSFIAGRRLAEQLLLGLWVFRVGHTQENRWLRGASQVELAQLLGNVNDVLHQLDLLHQQWLDAHEEDQMSLLDTSVRPVRFLPPTMRQFGEWVAWRSLKFGAWVLGVKWGSALLPHGPYSFKTAALMVGGIASARALFRAAKLDAQRAKLANEAHGLKKQKVQNKEILLMAVYGPLVEKLSGFAPFFPELGTIDFKNYPQFRNWVEQVLDYFQSSPAYYRPTVD